MSLAIVERQVEGVVVLDVLGRMTIEEHPERLSDHVHRCLAEGQRGYVVNLAGVPYCDSTGIMALLVSLLNVMVKHGEIVVVAIPPRVHELLRVARLLGPLPVADDVLAGVVAIRRRVNRPDREETT